MISAPRFSSFTVNDPASNNVLRATEIAVETTTEIDEVTNEELTVETSNVRISEEALDTLKLEQQAQAIRSQQTDTDKLVISQSQKIETPNALSEDEQAEFMAWINETPQARAAREIREHLQAVDSATHEVNLSTQALEQTYNSLIERINQHRPDLANKSFGFSVNAEGRIALLDTDDLNAKQVDYLEQALNGSSTLVKQAIDVANAHIALAEVEWHTRGIVLTRENYAKTIDIGADLAYRRAAKALPRSTDEIPTTLIPVQDYWRQQLFDKGQRAPGFRP